MKVERNSIIIRPNPRRVFFKPLPMGSPERSMRVIGRVMALPEAEVHRLVELVMADFARRHQRLRNYLLARYDQVRRHMLTDEVISEPRRVLIGAYFTQEYSLESAALFNPSMVWHPDQSGVPIGKKRFILSLRATGEGHISSITFRSGVIDEKSHIELDPLSAFATAPQLVPDPIYEKKLFRRKLMELGLQDDSTARVLGRLKDEFTFRELLASIANTEREERIAMRPLAVTLEAIRTVAEANYEARYEDDSELSERVVAPTSRAEMNGLEDARFVRFEEDDGSIRYFAPYTAYDGKVIMPQLLETDDFLKYKVSTLNGPEVVNKGFALFPRRIDGNYAMISRQDGENIYIMFSSMVHFWHTKQLLLKPTYPWEYVQIGNCGAPIETPEGWILLTHGVGPVRRYCMGAVLLDREDPTRVIGRLKEPLLTPDEAEREGYVPNVVYGCGGVLWGTKVIIPYSMSDYASAFATVELDELVEMMKAGIK